MSRVGIGALLCMVSAVRAEDATPPVTQTQAPALSEVSIVAPRPDRPHLGAGHDRWQGSVPAGAGADFKTVPMLRSSLGLVIVDISVGGIAATA